MISGGLTAKYLIERGAEIVLALPNGSQVQIDAR